MATKLDEEFAAACRVPQPDPAELSALIARGADVNSLFYNKNALFYEETTPLISIIPRRNPDTDPALVRLLLEAGADPNKPSKRGKWTPLLVAAAYCFEEIVELLVQAGADLNYVGKGDTGTVLMQALGRQPERIALLGRLLEGGADPNRRSEYGDSVMQKAIRERNEAAMHLLLPEVDLNALPDNPESHRGQSAFYTLVEKMPEPDWIDRFIACGADINGRQKDGRSAIIVPVFNGDLALFAQLLERGADLNLADNEGDTAFHRYLRYGKVNVDTVNFILNCGQFEDRQNKAGESYVYLAAARPLPEVLPLLVSAGASPDLPTAEGKTAVVIAQESGHAAILELLGVRPQPVDRQRPVQLAVQLLLEGYAIQGACVKIEYPNYARSAKRPRFDYYEVLSAVRDKFRDRLYVAETEELFAGWILGATREAEDLRMFVNAYLKKRNLVEYSPDEMRHLIETNERSLVARMQHVPTPTVVAHLMVQILQTGIAFQRSDKEGAERIFWENGQVVWERIEHFGPVADGQGRSKYSESAFVKSAIHSFPMKNGYFERVTDFVNFVRNNLPEINVESVRESMTGRQVSDN